MRDVLLLLAGAAFALVLYGLIRLYDRIRFGTWS